MNSEDIMKKWMKIFIITIALILVCIAGIATKIYYDLSKTSEQTFFDVSNERTAENSRKGFLSLYDETPFSIALLGIDTQDFSENTGRSDTIVVATLNPRRKEVQILSIPRDTYVTIIGREGKDKINHAYAYGGAGMTLSTLENYLEVPMDHYVSLDMTGLSQLVDIIDGVMVNNKTEFTYQGVTFPKGPQVLYGKSALIYSRMKKDDPLGDYGRQYRQRELILGIAKKLFNIKNLLHYQKMLTVLDKNMRTDLTFLDMKTIVLKYRPSFHKVSDLQLEGTERMIEGISYQEVSTEERTGKIKLLKENLEVNE